MPSAIPASYERMYKKKHYLNMLHTKKTAIVGSMSESTAGQALSLRKQVRSRVDYNFFNYCSTCNIKLPKHTLRCPECKQKVRTKPWHRSKIIQFKRI